MEHSVTKNLRCTICTHPDRAQIDADILNPDISLRETGRKWDINFQAINNHKSRHLTARVQRALRRRDEDHAEEKLLDKVHTLQETTNEFIRKAQKIKDPTKAAPLLEQARKNLEIEAIITGAMPTGQSQAAGVNVQRAIFVLPRDEELAKMTPFDPLAPAPPLELPFPKPRDHAATPTTQEVVVAEELGPSRD